MKGTSCVSRSQGLMFLNLSFSLTPLRSHATHFPLCPDGMVWGKKIRKKLSFNRISVLMTRGSSNNKFLCLQTIQSPTLRRSINWGEDFMGGNRALKTECSTALNQYLLSVHYRIHDFLPSSVRSLPDSAPWLASTPAGLLIHSHKHYLHLAKGPLSFALTLVLIVVWRVETEKH